MDLAHYGSELFQLFRRFHPQAAEGTGVGLFLVNRLVQAQGGHIEVESEVGQGTTFRVYLGQAAAEVAATVA
jgi:signal transduction histidine kinase